MKVWIDWQEPRCSPGRSCDCKICNISYDLFCKVSQWPLRHRFSATHWLMLCDVLPYFLLLFFSLNCIFTNENRRVSNLIHRCTKSKFYTFWKMKLVVSVARFEYHSTKDRKQHCSTSKCNAAHIMHVGHPYVSGNINPAAYRKVRFAKQEEAAMELVFGATR